MTIITALIIASILALFIEFHFDHVFTATTPATTTPANKAAAVIAPAPVAVLAPIAAPVELPPVKTAKEFATDHAKQNAGGKTLIAIQCGGETIETVIEDDSIHKMLNRSNNTMIEAVSILAPKMLEIQPQKWIAAMGEAHYTRILNTLQNAIKAGNYDVSLVVSHVSK